MKCREFREHLIEYLERTGSPEMEKRYQSHLERCRECADLARSAAHLWQGWHAVEPVEPGPDFSYRIRERLNARRGRRWNLSIVFPARLMRPVFASALIVLAIMIGIRLGSPARDIHPDAVPFTEQVQLFVEDHYIVQFSDFPPSSIGSIYDVPEHATREKML